MIKPQNIGSHFRTITEHKMLVMKYCFQVGLYRQGLLHDLSKYSAEEFWSGVYYYQGNRSPHAAASKVYKGKEYTSRSPLEYYEREKPYILLHSETRALLERLLHMLAEKGEKRTFAYIRGLLRKESCGGTRIGTTGK